MGAGVGQQVAGEGTARNGQLVVEAILAVAVGDSPYQVGHRKANAGGANVPFQRIADNAAAQEYWYRGRWYDSLAVYWQDFAKPGALKQRAYSTPGVGDHGILAVRTTVPARGQTAIRFVFSWNVPNCHNYWKKDCDSLRIPWHDVKENGAFVMRLR